MVLMKKTGDFIGFIHLFGGMISWDNMGSKMPPKMSTIPNLRRKKTSKVEVTTIILPTNWG
jgi:hypothetical protein